MALIIPNPLVAPGAHVGVATHELWTTIEWLATQTALGTIAAIRVWTTLRLFCDPSSGDVHLSRVEIAELVGISPGRTSRILTAFVRRKLITTRRERISGRSGPGRVIVNIYMP